MEKDLLLPDIFEACAHNLSVSVALCLPEWDVHVFCTIMECIFFVSLCCILLKFYCWYLILPLCPPPPHPIPV